MKRYIMPVHELIAKKDLLNLLVKCKALPTKFSDSSLGFSYEHAGLYWNLYHFYGDDTQWTLNREFYQEGNSYSGMICYPCSCIIQGDKPFIYPAQTYSYEDITELITSKIEEIQNENTTNTKTI